MAELSKITTPDGTTYDIKDATARANSGVTGVKGSAESSYRTGNVNITAANVGAYATGIAQIHRNPNNISADPQHASFGNSKNALEYIFVRPIAGIGDWFYAAYLNPDYTITCNYSGKNGTKGNFALSTLFSPSAASTTLLDVDAIAENPFVLEITKTNGGNITATDVVHLELWGHTTSYSGAALSDYKVELLTTGSTASTGTYTWQTVYERTGASDVINGLTMCLNPTSYSYLYFSGIRFTISGAIPGSTNPNAWNYNCIDLTLFRLIDQRPAFTTARAIGALDLAGGDVYGATNFRHGITGNLTGNVTGTATNVTGTVAIEHGGTGATSAAAARTNLGLGSAALAATAASVGNNTSLPTGSAIQTYVTGLGYETNQNAFSNVIVGSSTIAADSKTDSLTFAAGDNITLTPDTTNDKITIKATDTTYESKAAASGGTAVSLVTTGEKYTWNNKTSNIGTITQVKTSAGSHSTITASSGTASFNVPTKTSHLTNDSGFITSAGITSSAVVGALGYTPYDADNPSGYTANTGTITQVKTSAGSHSVITVSNGTASFNVPTKTSHLTNDSGYITSADVPEGSSAYVGAISSVTNGATSSGTNNGFARGDHVHNITSGAITGALGYTPYNSTNPNGYTSNTGTVTSVGAGTGLTGGPITSSGSLSLATVHTTAPGAKGDTSNKTPGFGGTFKALSGTVDAYGRVTAFADHTVTIPNTAATTAAAGLMSAADKVKLNTLTQGFVQLKVTDSDVQTIMVADESNDYTFGFTAGNNVELTPNSLGSVAINALNIPTFTTATTSQPLTGSGTQSLASGSNNVAIKNLKFVSPINGFAIITGNIQFASNASKTRHAQIEVSNATIGNTGGTLVVADGTILAASGAVTRIPLTGICQITTSSTITAQGWQNSGSALNVGGELNILFIEV